MSYLDEKLSEQFYSWEMRGRGWQVYDAPVSIEPPFRPFYGHFLPATSTSVDDGRKPTALSSFVERLRGRLAPQPVQAVEEIPIEEELDPDWQPRQDVEEFSISLPADLSVPRELFEQFLFNLSLCRGCISFELLATSDAITPLFAVHPSDALLIHQQLAAYFPEAHAQPQERMLESVWNEPVETAIVEFGLADEFMLPLATGKLDGFVGFAGGLADLQPGETGLFQVLFQPTHYPWAESALLAVTDNEGGPFFVNRPELVPVTRQKLSRPLFAAVLRLAAKAEDSERAWEILRGMAGSLSALNHPNGNELIPLRNDDYPFPCHIEDMLHRQSRRSGMLLNSEELLALVHLPSPAVQTPKLVRKKNHTKAAPKVVTGERGLLLGNNVYGGKITAVRLSPEQRVRHTHIVGASGTGKSTLLFNLIRQDIENGEGLAVLDPHGDLVEQVLGIIPPGRIQDVVLVDPSDEEFPVGFNILSAHSELEKTLLASDLVSVFQRLSTSWGDQMSSVLHNGILAFLESSEGGTLSDLRRFLLDPAFRNSFLKTVRDPEIVYYWQKGFPQLSGNKSIGPVLTRLETFLSPKPIRYIVSQKENRLDFAAFMDTGKIFLAKLPQGLIGRENAYLLGSLLVSKFQQVAMSRQRQVASGRRDFWIYADEFHHFITPSMAEILSGARKYRVGLVLAHQELRQLQRDEEVASAVLSNCFTRVVFRVGDSDARSLAEGFSSFETRDLQNLEIGEAVCRVERSDFDFNLSVPFADPEASSSETRDAVIAASRTAYGKPRSEIEEELFRKVSPAPGTEQGKKDISAADVRRPTEPLSEEHGEPVVEAAELKAPPIVKPVPVSLPAIAEPKPEISPPLPKTLGKGGQKHKYLQQFIKQWAQGMGYMAVIEEQVAGGQVDVSLQKNNRKIACEISVTTATEQEIGNVRKCLAASFDFVALVVPDEKRVAGFRKALQESLSDSEWLKIRVVTPDELFTFIEELDAKDANRRGTIRGYNVKVNHHAVDTISKKDRLTRISKILSDVHKNTKIRADYEKSND